MSNNLVITMCDDKYWPNGEWFIRTRHRVGADFILFSPDLSDDKVKVCHKNNIGTIGVDQKLWETKCQSLKFKFILEALDTYKNVTFCDFDTFFINDWHETVFKKVKALGITITERYPEWWYLRSKANGGVIFAKSNDVSKALFTWAYNYVIPSGHDIQLPAYNEIWKTLEDPKRKASKRHFRTNHAWWCDQVFLSALYLEYGNGYTDIVYFLCKQYNILNKKPTMDQTPGEYIGHLKKQYHVVSGDISG